MPIRFMALASCLLACSNPAFVTLVRRGGLSEGVTPAASEAPVPGPKPPAEVEAPRAPAPLPAPEHVRVGLIRVAFDGAADAPPGIRRTRDEATALAQQLANRLDQGEALAPLAARFSDDPSGRRGGEVGLVPVEALPVAWAAPLLRLTPGRATTVNAPQGVLVLQRLPADAPPRASWRAWPPGAEARARAGAEAWRAGRAPAADAASAEPEEVGPGQWPDPLDQALRALAPGEVSAPVSTPVGVYVVRREP